MKKPELKNKEWVFTGSTPACGNSYFNKTDDMVAIQYYDKIKLFYNRRDGIEGETASCFKDSCNFDINKPKTEGQKLVEFCDRMMGVE